MVNIFSFFILILFSVGCTLNSNIQSMGNDVPSHSGDETDGGDVIVSTVSFDIAASSVSEAAGTAIVTISLSQASLVDISVPFVASGTASNPTDYTISGSPVVISAGSTSTSITVSLINNSSYTVAKTIVLTMGTPTNATSTGVITHTMTITEDDPAYTVTKVFPINGSKWLSYIKNSNSNLAFYNQTDTACVGTETGRDGCFHGGDKLKVVVSGVTSCNGLSIADALGLFEWVCNVTSGAATFYSYNFKIGKGISDAIDFSLNDFLANSITVTRNGVPLGSSSSSKWWSNASGSNPIQALPSSSSSFQTLTGYAPGTILTVSASTHSLGYNIDQDQIAIVVKNNQVVTYSGNANNCDSSSGESAGPNWQALLCAGSQKYLWVEGTFKADNALKLESVFTLGMSKFSRINKLHIPKGAISANVYVFQSSQNIITDLSIQNFQNDYAALALEDANYNTIIKAQFDNTTGTSYYAAVYLYHSDYNVLSDIRASQMFDRGLYIEGANNVATRVFSASSGRGPTVNGQRNTLSHVSSIKHNGSCVGIIAAYNTINQLLCSVNAVGFVVQGTNDGLFSQFAILSEDYTLPFATEDVMNMKYTNNMLYHLIGGTACYINNSTNPGISGPACGNQGTSNANWVILSATTPMDPFVGQLSTDDVANTSDTSGSASYASITDWMNFDNLFRSWGTSTISACGSGTCYIWDYRLRSADTLLKNKSNNGSTANTPFIAGAACPAAVSGSKVLTDQQTVPNTFLVNAWEIINDGIGDEDGLCESDEACVYSPNFGAYQGEGDYKSNGTCTFQDGVVSGVIMYAYPMNGG